MYVIDTNELGEKRLIDDVLQNEEFLGEPENSVPSNEEETGIIDDVEKLQLIKRIKELENLNDQF